MGVITGEGAAIDGVGCLKQFKIVESSEAGDIYCSASKAGPVGAPGNIDWQGVAVVEGTTPAIVPGTEFTFTGALRNGKGVSGPAICTGFAVNWPVAANQPIWHELFFAGRGRLLKGDYSVSDASTPNPVSPQGRYAVVGGSNLSILEARLVIDRDAAENNDSDTGAYTNRYAGNWRGAAALRARFDDFSALPAIGQFKTFRLQTGASAQWIADYMQIRQVEDVIQVAAEDGKARLVEATIAGKWFGYYLSSIGSIVTPAGVTLWPGS
jgi:hypothetical protein